MADITQQKKKRNSYDEIDPETGQPYENIPGLEPDQVTENVLMAPLAAERGAVGVLNSGEGMIARMISKGVPTAAGAAEQAAAKTAGTAMGTAAGKVGASEAARAATGLSTREINGAIRAASPRVQEMVLNQPGMMERLKSEGLGLIQKLEEQIKEGTKSVARSSIGAKLRDQMPAPQSSPAPATAPQFAGSMKKY